MLRISHIAGSTSRCLLLRKNPSILVGSQQLHSSSSLRTSAHITSAHDLPFGSVEETVFAPLDSFTRRHVGPDESDIKTMLKTLGYENLNAFADDCVPASIRIDSKDISTANGMMPFSETEMLRRATEISEDNEVFRSFIGQGKFTPIISHVRVNYRPSKFC